MSNSVLCKLGHLLADSERDDFGLILNSIRLFGDARESGFLSFNFARFEIEHNVASGGRLKFVVISLLLFLILS